MPMRPERWRRVEEICHAALARDARDRALFLGDACAGDDRLRRDVESLLAQAASAEVVLGDPPVAMGARLVSGHGPSIPVGHRIGGYQVQAPLGAGGSASVRGSVRTRELRRDLAVAKTRTR